MNLAANIDLLMEGGASWRSPSKSELVNEWQSEPRLQDLFAYGNSLSSKNTYDGSNQLAFFLANYTKLSKVQTFKRPPKGLEFHKADSISELAAKTEYMGKDVTSLADAMRQGASLPYPLLVKDGSTYTMLGGRTRFGVAVLLGMPVKAVVLDKTKVDKAVTGFIRSFFIEKPALMFATKIDKAARKKLWDWVAAGEKGDMPVDPPKLPGRDPKFANHLLDMLVRSIKRALAR